MKGIAGRKAADALNPERRPAFRMNSITKAYLLTAMLALSTVSFGLGGVVDDAEAQLIFSDGDCGLSDEVPDDEASFLDSDCDDYLIGDLIGDSVPLGEAGEAMEFVDGQVRDVNDGDGAPLFPDNGRGEGDDDELQIVVPNSTAVLGYQDSDGDGYSDFEELSGCGTGVPINPTNPDAHCDNYDGDSLDNDEDPNPFTPDDLLILELVEQVDVASDDPLVVHYQCYEGTTDFKFTFALMAHDKTPAENNNGRVNGVGFSPDFEVTVGADQLVNTTGEDDRGDGCYENGLAIFDPDDLRLTVENAKGDHDDGVFLITMSGKNGGEDIESNEVELTLTNAAESGDWTPTCMLNKTSSGYSNGYCGEPGETATVNGVEITYDANGFPDKHPHPGTNVTYDVRWTFDHTSYSAEKQNITQISMQDFTADGNCDGRFLAILTGPNYISYNATSNCRDYDGWDNETYTGDIGGDGLYAIDVDYTVGSANANSGAGRETSAGHNRYVAIKAVDDGGGNTFWGEDEYVGSLTGLGVAESFIPDDHSVVFLGLPKYSRTNDLPVFLYIDGFDEGGGSVPPDVKEGHNSTDPTFVVHDRDDKTVALRVILHDNGNHSAVDAPGDDLDVSLQYAIADSINATDLEYTTISGLPTSRNLCIGFGVPVVSQRECDFSGDDDDDTSSVDAIDDRIDGNTYNSEAFEGIISSVEDGDVLHYTFSVIDSDGAEVEYGTTFTYVVGELPLDDPPVSTLAGSELSTMIQNVVDEMDDRFETAAGVLTGQEDSADTGDPWDTDEDGDTSEPNGQLDVVERFAYYIDTDEGSNRDVSTFDDFDGYDGADGVSLHLAPTGGTGIEETDHSVVRVGDVAGSDLFELAVLTDGTDTLCVVEHPGQYDVSLYMGGKYKSDADAPCGEEISSDLTLKAVRISNDGFTGIIVYNDENNDDERDGAEDRRSNMEAQSCEDVLIVAINTGEDPSLSEVRLLEAEPYPEDPCDGSDDDGGDDGDADGDGIPDEVDDEVPDEGATDDSDGDGIPDVVDDEVPDEGATDDSDGDGIPDVVDDEVPDEDPFNGLCVKGTPIGWVGICYDERHDVYVVVIGPISGPVLPF